MNEQLKMILTALAALAAGYLIARLIRHFSGGRDPLSLLTGVRRDKPTGSGSSNSKNHSAAAGSKRAAGNSRAAADRSGKGRTSSGNGAAAGMTSGAASAVRRGSRERNGGRDEVLTLVSSLVSLSRRCGYELVYPGTLSAGTQTAANTPNAAGTQAAARAAAAGTPTPSGPQTAAGTQAAAASAASGTPTPSGPQTAAGTQPSDAPTSTLLAILVTPASLVGINIFGFGGHVTGQSRESDWRQTLNGQTRSIPNPLRRSAQQQELVAQILEEAGIRRPDGSALPLTVLPVFTGSRVEITGRCAGDVFKTGTLLKELRESRWQEGPVPVRETAAALKPLIRTGRESAGKKSARKG